MEPSVKIGLPELVQEPKNVLPELAQEGHYRTGQDKFRAGQEGSV